MKEPCQLRGGLCAKAAFSMIELLVVVAILAVIVTLYLNYLNPSTARRDRELTSCRENMERIYLAMDIYSRDNNGKYPVVTNAHTSEEALAPLVPHYSSDTGIFLCPSSDAADTTQPTNVAFRDWKISYAYYMGRKASDGEVVMSDEQINTRPKSKGDTVFSETGKPPGNNHRKDGGNFMMCDGSVESSGLNAPFPLSFTQPIVLLNPKP
jgi:prepilin-type N-terminal cleavage/methylation domain-containing protein/prepilin-type processing-associated H-X9-DG protein